MMFRSNFVWPGFIALEWKKYLRKVKEWRFSHVVARLAVPENLKHTFNANLLYTIHKLSHHPKITKKKRAKEK